MCVFLGLALLALGIMGLTGLMPMSASVLTYVYIGEIVLGGIGFIAGVYARQSRANSQRWKQNKQQRKENDQQRKENYEQPRIERPTEKREYLVF
ncbi:MAG: hypothetical protein KK926_00600 [Methanomethylovorans sp.]|jgi:arginine exporter protein ArgO|nr:hypothetical protein [Methanomethylovorans sp.]